MVKINPDEPMIVIVGDDDVPDEEASDCSEGDVEFEESPRPKIKFNDTKEAR